MTFTQYIAAFLLSAMEQQRRQRFRTEQEQQLARDLRAYVYWNVEPS